MQPFEQFLAKQLNQPWMIIGIRQDAEHGGVVGKAVP